MPQLPCPRQNLRAGCGRGSRYVTARSSGSPQGQPGFHYITQAALETPLRAIGCRAAFPANSTRLCKSSLSQHFLWLWCMQIDVIARVGVPGPGIRGVDEGVCLQQGWFEDLTSQICSSQSREAQSASKGECPQFFGPFPFDSHKQRCKNEVNCWAW